MTKVMKVSEEQLRMADELLFSEDKEQSFASGMFGGRFLEDKIMPYGEVPEAEKARLHVFLKELRSFLQMEVDPDWIDRHAEIPMDLIKGFGKVGLLGMTVPKRYGGRDFSIAAYCQAMELVAARCASCAVFINAHHSIGLRTILLYGSEEQKKTYLPDLSWGNKIAAFALTEEKAGSDVANIQTIAIYDEETDSYLINGSKRYITNGSIADVLTIMVKTPVLEKGVVVNKVSAFLVDSDTVGFEVIEEHMEKVGIRGTWTAKLEFHNMRVPASSLIGEKGGGLAIPLKVLNFGRITFGATCVGAAKFCLGHSVTHARSRIQFGHPLAAFGLIRKKLARMSAYTYAMEAATYNTASMFDREVDDYMIEAAMVKVFASETLWEVVNETIQIHGGKGFFCDLPFERMMRDARLNSIGEGASEVLKNFIGLTGMHDIGMEMQTLQHNATHLDELKDLVSNGVEALSSMFSLPDIPLEIQGMDTELEQLAQRYKQLHWKVVKLLLKHREAIVDAQYDVERIACFSMLLYMCSTSLVRYDHESRSNEISEIKLRQNALNVKVFFEFAMQEIDHIVSELRSEFDDDLDELAESLTGIE
jgi:acyl-CoA dehydrogenase family member 9